MTNLTVTKNSNVDRVTYTLTYADTQVEIIGSIRNALENDKIDKIISAMTGVSISIVKNLTTDDKDNMCDTEIDDFTVYDLRVGARHVECLIDIGDYDLKSVQRVAEFIADCANKVKHTIDSENYIVETCTQIDIK